MRGRRMMLLLAVAFLWLGTAPSRAVQQARVLSDNVNLRAAAEAEAEVVGQVSRSDVLDVQEWGDAWVRIEPPSRVTLWVYAELVREGAVAVSNVRVRAGPGINYRALGKLQKGDAVTIREKKGDWLGIAPPPGSSLWVSRQYVNDVAAVHVPVRVDTPPVETASSAQEVKPPAERAPASVAKPPMPASGRRPAVAAEPASPRTVSPAPATGDLRAPAKPPAPRADAGQWVPSARQGQRVTYQGVLQHSFFVWRRPSKYSLMGREDGGRVFVVCYVHGNEAQLASIKGRAVRLSGREYWVQGVRHPVLVTDRIVHLN